MRTTQQAEQAMAELQTEIDELSQRQRELGQLNDEWFDLMRAIRAKRAKIVSMQWEINKRFNHANN